MKKSERSHEAVERAAQWPHEPRKSSISCYQHYSAPWGEHLSYTHITILYSVSNKAKYLNFEVVRGCTTRHAVKIGTVVFW